MRIAIGLLAGAALISTARPVNAQTTTCTVSGEYVLAATLLSPPGPGQTAGVFVFTPAAGCQAGAAGTVAINVVTAYATGVLPYQATAAYTVQGTDVSIAGGCSFPVSACSTRR